MMAAAQAAAEAALREVEERNQNEVQPQSAEPSEANLAALLQQGSQEGQCQAGPIEFSNEGSMQSLLQMMAQEEQQRQQIAALAAIAARPKEHYISIAQNGELCFVRQKTMVRRSACSVYLLFVFISLFQVRFLRRQKL